MSVQSKLNPVIKTWYFTKSEVRVKGKVSKRQINKLRGNFRRSQKLAGVYMNKQNKKAAIVKCG